MKGTARAKEIAAKIIKENANQIVVSEKAVHIHHVRDVMVQQLAAALLVEPVSVTDVASDLTDELCDLALSRCFTVTSFPDDYRKEKEGAVFISADDVHLRVMTLVLEAIDQAQILKTNPAKPLISTAATR